jgi:hypothetical protein
MEKDEIITHVHISTHLAVVCCTITCSVGTYMITTKQHCNAERFRCPIVYAFSHTFVNCRSSLFGFAERVLPEPSANLSLIDESC